MSKNDFSLLTLSHNQKIISNLAVKGTQKEILNVTFKNNNYNQIFIYY